jgi:FkbM family methyltransferase
MIKASAACAIGALLRRLPQHRGRFRLTKFALRILGETPIRGAYGVRMLSNWTDNTNLFSIVGGHYDEVFSVVNTLQPGMAFVDIGANAGVFSMVAGRRVGGSGVVVAFEPQRQVYRYLVANAELNGLRSFYPFMAAVGSFTALCSFDEGPHDHSGMGHISKSGSVNVLQLGGSELQQTIGTLIGNRKTMVKIDVEGAEADAIRACYSLLSSEYTETVIIEIDDSLMLRFGYASSDVYGAMERMGYYPERGPGLRPHFDEVFRRNRW